MFSVVDEFIEVKIDLANVEEDDMFPASMFEATDDDKPLPSDHVCIAVYLCVHEEGL